MANPNVLGKRKRGESEEEDQQDDESRRPKRAKRPANVRDKLRDLYRLRITAKIKSEFQVLQLVEYRLGAQGANTQCYGTQYKTGHKGQPNMHSEILAIK